MAITDKTRKLLWGRSGNRCAICKHELVLDRTDLDDESVVGEECHIISEKENGPRHKSDFPIDEFDSYENLILLCRIHHKMVDDQFETYTEEILKQFKHNHEKWVTDRLSKEEIEDLKPIKIKRVKENTPIFLQSVSSGKELFKFIDGAMGYSFEHDEPKNDVEVELISSFFQLIQDVADLFDDFESSDKVRIGHEITQTIKELEASDYLVFGAREVRIIKGGIGSPADWPIAIIHVYQRDNNFIVTNDDCNSMK